MSAALDLQRRSISEVRRRLGIAPRLTVVLPEAVGLERKPFREPVPVAPTFQASFAVGFGFVPILTCKVTFARGISSKRRARIIAQECCIDAGITFGEMTGHQRKAHIVEARHKAMWRISKELGWSLPRIGGFMGNRDHTSVMHAIRKMDGIARKRGDAIR